MPSLYKSLPLRYHLRMIPEMKTTRGGEHACAQHHLVDFLNRFSGL